MSWKIESICEKHGKYVSTEPGKFGNTLHHSCPQCKTEIRAKEVLQPVLEAIKNGPPELIAELKALLKS